MKLPSLAEWREFEATQPRPKDGLPLLDRLPPEWIAALDPLEVLALSHDPRAYLRAAQLPPTDGDWLVWLLQAGRGHGKSVAGAGWIISNILAATPDYPAGDIALVAPTIEQAWDLQWRTIREILPPWVRFVEMRARGQVVFPDARGRLLIWSGTDPEYRGPNLRAAWLDEAVKYPQGARLWGNLRLALRVPGRTPPRACITTSPPRESSWLLALAMDPLTRLTRGRMRDNPALAPEAVAAAYRALAGTVEGRRELDGEVVFGTDGALFRQEHLDRDRVAAPPVLAQVIVAIDPSQSGRKEADTAGVVALGISYAPKHFYVLASSSTKEEPRAWARRAIDFATRHHAGKIVIERAGGGGSGAMAAQIVRAEIALGGHRHIPIEDLKVQGTSKSDRAQPVASLAASGRMHLVGEHPELERELTTWTPDSSGSPGGLDALSAAASALTNGFRWL